MPLATLPAGQRVKTESVTWRGLLEQIDPELAKHGAQGRDWLQSLEWDAIVQNGEPRGKSIAVFRSANRFQIVSLTETVDSRAVVGSSFYIRPLLKDLATPKSFYLLALSQNDVRLLHCTHESCDEVEWPRDTAASFDAYMDTAKPDHNDSNETSAGPSSGHSKGIVGTTSTIRETKPEYLAHFFRQIDRAVHQLLRENNEPLVLAAVDYEVAQYRSLNTYPHLCDEAVHGAPNGLRSGEMHARAIQALAKSAQNRADEVLVEYDHKVGAGASNRIKDVVKAAHDGRVMKLLVSDTLEQAGTFDPATDTAKGHRNGAEQEEDLVNDAAIQTILHSGAIFCLPNSKMPNGAAAAAVFRY